MIRIGFGLFMGGMGSSLIQYRKSLLGDMYTIMIRGVLRYRILVYIGIGWGIEKWKVF